MKTIFVLSLALASFIYLLNPTAGIVEFIPDNFPFLGNVDEGISSFILYSSFEYFRRKKIGMFGQRNK